MPSQQTDSPSKPHTCILFRSLQELTPRVLEVTFATGSSSTIEHGACSIAIVDREIGEPSYQLAAAMCIEGGETGPKNSEG